MAIKSEDEIRAELLEALISLEAAVATVKSGPARPDLGALFKRIDDLADQLPVGSDPQLGHYLQRKSYEKARLHLQDGGAGHGAGRTRA